MNNVNTSRRITMKTNVQYAVMTLILIAFLLVGVGCQTQGPYAPLKRGTSLEGTESLVLLDKPLQKLISVDAQRASYTTEGRIIAEAILRNNSDNAVNVQAQTVFKDDAGFSSGDETAWVTLILPPNGQSTYKAVALNERSQQYSIRIRMER